MADSCHGKRLRLAMHTNREHRGRFRMQPFFERGDPRGHQALQPAEEQMLVARSCSAKGQWESCSQTKHHATGSRLGTSRWKFTSYAISQTLAKGRGFMSVRV